MNKEKDELINKINQLNEKPGGKQAVRFILNVLGGVPIAGGAIAGAGQFWGEKKQQGFNEALAEWVTKTNSDLTELSDNIDKIIQTPTKAKLSLLIGEIVGDKLAKEFLSKPNQFIPIALHSQTLNELEPFIEKNWIKIIPTHSAVQMGAGNKVGNNIEDLKRPYGYGSTFKIYINQSFFFFLERNKGSMLNTVDNQR